MENFYLKYRKLLIVLCICLLIYYPFEVYRGVTLAYTTSNMYRGVGVLFSTALIYLLVPIYLLVSINNAYRKSKAGTPHF